MIRYKDNDSSLWEDHLKSVNEDKQLEACRNRLLAWDGRSLFDEIGSQEFRQLRQRSYDAREKGALSFGPEKLRQAVIGRAGREAMYLSRSEDELLKKMIVSGWSVTVDDWDLLPAAESLIRRHWCTMRFNDEDDSADLTVVPELREVLIHGLEDEKYPVIRDALFRFGAMLYSIRYIYGFVFPCPLMSQFCAELEKKDVLFDQGLTERFIKAEFDYMMTDDGQLFLPHPALAFPERMLSRSRMPETGTEEITFESMLGGMGGILPEEVPSVTCFRGIIAGALRPEFDPVQAVDDLRYMAKQGADLKDMTRILKNASAVLPSKRMIDALERMRQEAVLWTGCLSAVPN